MSLSSRGMGLARVGTAAALSVLAHLEDLVARGDVATRGPPSIAGRYRLAGVVPVGV